MKCNVYVPLVLEDLRVLPRLGLIACQLCLPEAQLPQVHVMARLGARTRVCLLVLLPTEKAGILM